MNLKHFTFWLFLFAFITNYVNAQNLLIDDFENGQVSFTNSVNTNPPTAGKFEVEENPSQTGINTSTKCWKYTRLESSPDWAGFWSSVSEPFNTSGYKYLHIKYYRTNANSRLRVLFEGNGFKKEFLPMSNHAPSTVNTWEHLVYDLQAEGLMDKTVSVFGLQPDFFTPGSVNTTVYIDDIFLSPNESGEGKFDFSPKNVKAINVQTNQLDLVWSPLQEAVLYDVYQNDTFLKTVTEASLSVTGLEEYSLYKFYVIAKNAEKEESLPSSPAYVQTAETKDKRDTRMAWWREARFGMFIHWGGYATYAGHYDGLNVDGVPAPHPDSKPRYTGDGSYYSEWIMFGARIPGATYREKVLSNFNASNYKPREWVKMAKDAGMKYIIITSKHHEGLALFDTHVGWNVLDHTVAGKDLMKELVDEARAAGLKIGFYYSQALDWNNKGGMGYIQELGGEYSIQDKTNYVENTVVPHIQEIINKYNIDLLWFDMGEPKYPELQYKTLKAVKDIQGAKNIIMNDRLAFPIDNGKSGDFLTPEQSIPDVPVTGRADGQDWETCMTMNENWGYCSFDDQWKSTQDMILKLIDIASKGGNYLLNVGPKADGTFPQESIERLTQVGQWMSVNGEAIYGTLSNPIDKVMDWGKITRKIDENGNTTLYLHVANWPSNGQLNVPLLNSQPLSATLLGSEATLAAEKGSNSLIVKGLPIAPVNQISTTIKLAFNGDISVGENYVLPDETNKISLLPKDSKTTGVCVEGDPQNFGCWATTAIGSVSGDITWKMKVEKSGNYAISSELGATDAGIFHLELNGTVKDLNYPGTNGAAYEVKTLGSITLDEGVYNVKLTRSSTKDGWNYVNLRSIILSYTGGTGTNNPTPDNIRIYAQKGILHIDGIEKGNLIEIYDITGRLIKSKRPNDSSESVSLNGETFVIVKISGVENFPPLIRKVMVR